MPPDLEATLGFASKTTFEVEVEFKVGDRVLFTTPSGMIIDAKVINVSEPGNLLLKYGERIEIAQIERCKPKSKRVVRGRKLKARIGDANRDVSGPALFI